MRWWFALLLTPMLAAWRLHPIHAARVELRATSNSAIAITVHVYRDDLGPGLTLSSAATYFDRALVLMDAGGHRVALKPTAITPEGDRLRIDLIGPSAVLSHGHIMVALLQERFADQINVLDAQVDGRRAQLVFLRGDRPQALP